MSPDGARKFRILAECSGPQCDLLNPVTAETEMSYVDSFATAPGDAEAIGSAHGITLISESTQHLGLDRTSFGA